MSIAEEVSWMDGIGKELRSLEKRFAADEIIHEALRDCPRRIRFYGFDTDTHPHLPEFIYQAAETAP